jgi:hypothetical protein
MKVLSSRMNSLVAVIKIPKLRNVMNELLNKQGLAIMGVLAKT